MSATHHGEVADAVRPHALTRLESVVGAAPATFEASGCTVLPRRSELTARTRLVVHGTGRVSGSIRYGKLIVAEGGEISGDEVGVGWRALTTVTIAKRAVRKVSASARPFPSIFTSRQASK